MDSLVRAVTEDHAVRFVTVVTTSLSREACRRLEAKEMEARVLSRLCTTGCMLATIAKEGHERVMINIRADGPIGRLIADAWGDGRARACLEQRLSEHEAPMDHAMTGVRPSIAHAVGTSGSLTVTRDLGLEPFLSSRGREGARDDRLAAGDDARAQRGKRKRAAKAPPQVEPVRGRLWFSMPSTAATC